MSGVVKKTAPIRTERSIREFSLYKNSKDSARAAAIGDCLNKIVLTADLKDSTLFIIDITSEYHVLPYAFSTGSVSSKLTVWKLSDVIGQMRKHIHKTYLIYNVIMYVSGVLFGVLMSNMLR